MLRASWIAVFLLAGCNAAQGPTVDRDTGVDSGPDADATLADADANVDAKADADADADANADADADPDADAYADPDADAYADPDADAAPDADADLWPGTIVCEASDAAVDAAPGTTFCEIYVDVFSPTGSAKCQSEGCHGGAVGINGLAMGWTGKSCYDALTTHDVPWLPPHRVVQIVDGGDSRPGSLLPAIVDPAADAGLLMPYPKPDGGNRLLDDSERARIDAWLSRGAPFD